MEPLTHEAPEKARRWLGCRQKSCCSARAVTLNGSDMWRISAALELDPWSYSVPVEAGAESPAAFKLEPGGNLYEALLLKRGTIMPTGATCLFLWRIPEGHAQCGLGSLRPLSCITYPLVTRAGALCVDSMACSCEQWDDFRPTGTETIYARVMEEDAQWLMVVEGWNSSIEAAGTSAGYPDFCHYVLEAYNRLYGDVDA